MAEIDIMRKNILMIVADQLRYDSLGYCNGIVKTPNIDELKRDGMCFTQAYTPLPSCCPARQAIMTGKTPERLKALWNYDCALPVHSIGREEFTFSSALNANGYSTGYIGKWHVSENFEAQDFGFEKYVSERDYAEFLRNKCPDLKHTKIDWVRGWGGNPSEIPLEFSRTRYFADKTAETVEEFHSREKNWFVRMDFVEPHLPCFPSSPYSEMYNSGDIPPWGGFCDSFENKPFMQKNQLKNWHAEDMDWKDWSKIVALYYGWISQTDEAIGRVIAKLKTLGIYDDTVIVFTADHGDMCGSHKMPDKHYVLYDDIVRVPLIIKGFEKGECGDFVMNMDLCPSILDMAGIETEEKFDGFSMLPALRGNIDRYKRDFVVSTFNGQQFGLYTLRMIRDKRYKYIYNTQDVDELYDMEQDPCELNNLVGNKEYRGLISEMRKKLYGQLEKQGDRLIANPWIKDRLLNSCN